MLRNDSDLRPAHAIFPTQSNASEWMDKARKQISVWLRRNRTRHDLSKLDDHLLGDVGLSRADQIHEAGKPFWK